MNRKIQVRFDDVPEVVRQRMSRIRKAGTRPEMLVRKAVRALGLRYRVHRRDLPGTPDLAFIGRRKAIFVHGCFWHQHGCRLTGKTPSKRTEYWGPKLARNVERDRNAQADLAAKGWSTLTIWECEASLPNLMDRLRTFLLEE